MKRELTKRAHTTLYYVSYGVVIGVFFAVGTAIFAEHSNPQAEERHHAEQ